MIVEVGGPVVDKLIEEHSYYREAVIPGGMYRGNPKPVRTFGVGATFVSSTRTPEHVIYEVVKSVFSELERFRQLHPAFRMLDREQMTTDGLSAPLHDGARAYFEEAGLL